MAPPSQQRIHNNYNNNNNNTLDLLVKLDEPTKINSRKCKSSIESLKKLLNDFLFSLNKTRTCFFINNLIKKVEAVSIRTPEIERLLKIIDLMKANRCQSLFPLTEQTIRIFGPSAALSVLLNLNKLYRSNVLTRIDAAFMAINCILSIFLNTLCSSGVIRDVDNKLHNTRITFNKCMTQINKLNSKIHELERCLRINESRIVIREKR